ncbi:HD-GYP domain-containing protein [Lysinibacillus antri]|uniref:HD-GYP domain-containing protein n=1 Tax=Lysinibacillus antri TaxID=2498145 RepID=A0A3S0R4I1_9BACI|nr:HD-GYP domain-containing protein [Lysinibacillus antri]RUL48709.1 HD-GYP domain-containing protein [Lysinibacillus antri]
MDQLFTRWLDKPIYFRIAFVVILLFSSIINQFILNGDGKLYTLYILSVILLGIGFYNKPLLLIVLTILVVTCRYILIPDSHSRISIYLIHVFTYLFITFISAGLMKYIQKVREHHLELTTTLANALDSRDPYTRHHSENVAKYSVLIAQKMNLPKDYCDIIRKGALLHDIGKIGIPEHILTKNEKLTDEEYHIIKSHPVIGHKMIQHIATFHKNGVLDIVLYHHERFDGKGYPKGLKGTDIPLFARIVAVADTFDAMTSKRVYRNELDLNYTLNEIRKNKGTQFDPEIVDVFLSLFEDNQTILERK